jgi:uroporphyrinogen decarboxylase
MTGPTKPLLRVFAGEAFERPPWWLMRQAGRYLPEYRALRARCPDFVSLCLTPKLAAEVTLQPVRRFGMDAAILFSDILLLPRALGQPIVYEEDGPKLEPVVDTIGIARLHPEEVLAAFAPVCETVQRCRAALPGETTLIGFAGAPWTVACYMVEGSGSRDFRRVKAWAYRDPPGFGTLIELLTESTIEVLAAQISAGAEVVQLFDTWAGILAETSFERWVVEPTKRIVAALKQRHAACPVIGFPRAAGHLYERYAAATGVDGLGLDATVPMTAARFLQSRLPVQGNLDPLLLAVGGAPLCEAVAALRVELGGGPYIFNLGHGVLPETPPENVALLAGLLAES